MNDQELQAMHDALADMKSDFEAMHDELAEESEFDIVHLVDRKIFTKSI
jgi:hypothetical protein